MPLITPQPADPLTPGPHPPARPPARAGAGAPAVPLGSVAPSVGAYRTCCRRARSRASVSPRPQRTSCHAEQPLAHGTGRLERRLPHQLEFGDEDGSSRGGGGGTVPCRPHPVHGHGQQHGRSHDRDNLPARRSAGGRCVGLRSDRHGGLIDGGPGLGEGRWRAMASASRPTVSPARMYRAPDGVAVVHGGFLSAHARRR